MLPSPRRSTLPHQPDRPRRQNGGWSRGSYILFLIRQQAQAGLLRDGGTIPDEVSDYVLQLRREVETDIANRFRRAQ
jgi:hypothetical protein